MKMNITKSCPARKIEDGHFKKTLFSRKRICVNPASFVFALSLTFLLLTAQVKANGSADSLVKKNQITIGLGVNYMKTLDLLYSPQMYRSVRKDLHLGYLHKSKNGIFSSDFDVFLGSLKPNSGADLIIYAAETDIHGVKTTENIELEMTQIGFSLQLAYLRQLHRLSSYSKAFYLGGSLEESLTYTPGFINVGVINYGSLNAKARFDYFLKNGKPVIFELAFPVVSVVTRLPYNQSPGAPDQSSLGAFFTGNNKVETLNHFQNAQFSLKYTFLVKKRIALNIKYKASWMHYYMPKHLTQTGNQLSLGLTF